MLVRATLTLRNAAMIEQRKKFHLSQITLAELARVPTVFVQQIEKLDFSMFDGRARPLWEQRLTAVAGVLEVEPQEIVPEDARGKIFQTRFISIKDVSSDRMLGYQPKKSVLSLPFTQVDVRLILRKVLPERRADAIRMLALEGMTANAVGESMRLCGQAVMTHYRYAVRHLNQIARSGHYKPMTSSGINFQLNPEELDAVRNLVSLLNLGESKSDRISIDAFLKAAAEQGLDLAAAFGKLTYRESAVVKLRYGLADGHVYALVEVAKRFNVTRERARQIETKAIRKLQDYLTARNEQKQLDEKETHNASAQHP